MFNKKLFKKITIITVAMAMVVGCVFGVTKINSNASSSVDPRGHWDRFSIGRPADAPGVDHIFYDGSRYGTTVNMEYDINGVRYYALQSGAICQVRTRLINLVCDQVGKKYVKGHVGPNSFDCSGLVKYVYDIVLREIGAPDPMLRTSSQQATVGEARTRATMMAGDIICFEGHVGIYIGMNQMVHAANPSKGVVVDSIEPGTYWGEKIKTIRHMYFPEIGGSIMH